MTREVYAVYGVGKSSRKWSPGICLAVRDTKEQAEKAVKDITYRMQSRPTRIVRRDAKPPYAEHEEWRLW